MLNFAAMKTTVIWIGALVVGAILGLLGLGWLDEVMNFVATVYTRLELYSMYLSLQAIYLQELHLNVAGLPLHKDPT